MRASRTASLRAVPLRTAPRVVPRPLARDRLPPRPRSTPCPVRPAGPRLSQPETRYATNKDSLQRLIATHRAFAAVSQSHLRRHWRRELSRQEIDTVHDFTLCATVLAMESVERGLAHSASGADADRYFYFMQSEVATRGPQVVTDLRRRVAQAAQVPAPARSQNLLAWEESLLAWLN